MVLNETPDDRESAAAWPLSYRLQVSLPSRTKWWSYSLYRGPDDKKVQVLYSKDKQRSEELAKKFLEEPVVGFDMEWPCFPSKNNRLQEKIGLIQVASEDTIALFHIGLHPGKTTDEIMAPSLRTLIESPAIAKTGVGILSADFARLKRYFGLKPQGAFELSHMNRLVKFTHIPKLLTTKLVKLAYQVEEHLGLPLSKGPVRTSNWSRPLNQQQIDYAASDAYADSHWYQCRLYQFFSEQYPPRTKGAKGFEPITTLMLHPIKEGGGFIMADRFFSAKQTQKGTDDVYVDGDSNTSPSTTATEVKKKPSRTKPGVEKEPLSYATQVLYDQLSDRRKVLAKEQGVAAYIIASNAVLHGLAQRMPKNDGELLEVKGIGKASVARYGTAWLEVIARHEAVDGIQDKVPETSDVHTNSQTTQPNTPIQNSKGRPINADESPESSPSFSTPPVKRTPALHTGLSFTLAETNIDAATSAAINAPYPSLRRPDVELLYEGVEIVDLVGGSASGSQRQSSANGASRLSLTSDDHSQDSLVFVTPPSRTSSSLKRKRREDQAITEAHTHPPPQPAPLSPQSKIFRNKLLAFSKLVTRKLGSPPNAVPIVSDSTLDHIVAISPRTTEQLQDIAGVDGFLRACNDAQMDLLRNINKFAPARP
ncbi:hypothetical protein N0V90_008944 [Kalmusia sp. IMI 367209]|nr:hypothetical protein N0V90_008944 [Kalmusia sp. IMI 367209]